MNIKTQLGTIFQINTKTFTNVTQKILENSHIFLSEVNIRAASSLLTTLITNVPGNLGGEVEIIYYL